MTKTFDMENEVGIVVKYTILAITDIEGVSYVVYTNHLPSDNELGVRVEAGKLISMKPIKVERLRRTEQKPIVDAFILEMIKSGAKIKK